MREPTPITLREASDVDRPRIYRIRHDVYAVELGQHSTNEQQLLQDDLDEINTYIVAERDDEIVGFLSLIEPRSQRFGFDRYFAREQLPFEVDDGTCETRLLTLVRQRRIPGLANVLLYAGYQQARYRGATRLVGTGHAGVRDLYRAIGFHFHDLSVTTGALTFHLMSAHTDEIGARIRPALPGIDRLLAALLVDWKLDVPRDYPLPA